MVGQPLVHFETALPAGGGHQARAAPAAVQSGKVASTHELFGLAAFVVLCATPDKQLDHQPAASASSKRMQRAVTG